MTPFPWPPPACIHVRGICSPRNKLSDAARAHTQNGVRSRTYAVCTAARSPYEVRKNLQDAIFGQEISKQCPVYKEVFACHKTAPISTSNFVDTDSGGVSPADKVGDSLSLFICLQRRQKQLEIVKDEGSSQSVFILFPVFFLLLLFHVSLQRHAAVESALQPPLLAAFLNGGSCCGCTGNHGCEAQQ